MLWAEAVRGTVKTGAVREVTFAGYPSDQQMLVTPHLAKLVGHDSPMLHLRRLQDDGRFDRFHRHAEELCSDGRPVS